MACSRARDVISYPQIVGHSPLARVVGAIPGAACQIRIGVFLTFELVGKRVRKRPVSTIPLFQNIGF
jgi:hypothetical protein